jgi:hypothetical protein
MYQGPGVLIDDKNRDRQFRDTVPLIPEDIFTAASECCISHEKIRI